QRGRHHGDRRHARAGGGRVCPPDDRVPRRAHRRGQAAVRVPEEGRRMSLFDSLFVALSALRTNLLRSVLTTLGIIIGVGSVIIMVAVGSGATSEIDKQIASLGSDMLVVYPGASRVRGRSAGAGTTLPLSERDLQAIRDKVPDVVAISGYLQGSAPVVYGNMNWTTSIGGLKVFFSLRVLGVPILGFSINTTEDFPEKKLLIEVLDEISRDHQVYFTYDSDLIQDIIVDYEKKEGESVRSILSRVLAEINMDFKIFEDRFVILYRNDEAGLVSLEKMIAHMEEIVKDRKELFASRRSAPVVRLKTDKWTDVNRKRL